VLLALLALAIVAVALAAPLLFRAAESWSARRVRGRKARRVERRELRDPGRERRAEQRARELLRSCVNDEEWGMYRDLGFIRVTGRLWRKDRASADDDTGAGEGASAGEGAGAGGDQGPAAEYGDEPYRSASPDEAPYDRNLDDTRDAAGALLDGGGEPNEPHARNETDDLKPGGPRSPRPPGDEPDTLQRRRREFARRQHRDPSPNDDAPYAYLIYPHKPIVAYVPKTGRLLSEYCVEFPDLTGAISQTRLPDSDDVLAKWMALTGDEERLIRNANMHLPGRQVDPGRVRRDLWRLSEWERQRRGSGPVRAPRT
jgi:hypothetical protein